MSNEPSPFLPWFTLFILLLISIFFSVVISGDSLFTGNVITGNALEDQPFLSAKEAIKQKAEDVAKQIEIYLNSHPELTIKELQGDSYFQEIAVQKVGKTGYTAVTDYETLICRFHINPSIVNLDLSTLSNKLPGFWSIMSKTKGGKVAEGIYDWQEADGSIKQKYMYIALVKSKTGDNKRLHVAATTYVEEYNNITTLGTFYSKYFYILIGTLFFLLLTLFFLSRFKIINLGKGAMIIGIFLLFLIIISLFLFNTFQVTSSIKQQGLRSVTSSLESFADSEKNYLERVLDNELNSLIITSTNSDLTDNKLIEIISIEENDGRIFIIDNKGKIVHSSKPEMIGMDISNEEYYKNWPSSPTYWPAHESEHLYYHHIDYIVPFHDNLLIKSVPLESLSSSLTELDKLGESGEILLGYLELENRVEIFSKRKFDSNKTKSKMSIEDEHPMVFAIKGREEIFKGFKDYRGEDVLAVTRYLSDYGIGIVVKVDSKEALSFIDAQINKVWLFSFGIIFTLIILGIVSNILITSTLRREISKKTSALQKSIINLKNTKTAMLNMMDDINEANKNLKELDKTKGEFLNMVSHELKTPLTAIIAHLDVLDDMKGNLTKEELQSFEAIKRNSNNLKILISNILEISRMEAGKFELTKIDFDMSKLITNTVNNLQIIAKQKGLKLIKEIEKLPKINADDTRIQEILNNLITNSLKFTNKGHISISAKKEGKNIKVSISDTGIGIPKDKIKNLFHKFYQVDGSISRRYGGTGLGLSITKRLIEGHNGRISVKSKAGKGTTFTFTIPIKEKTILRKEPKIDMENTKDPFSKFDSRIKRIIKERGKK